MRDYQLRTSKEDHLARRRSKLKSITDHAKHHHRVQSKSLDADNIKNCLDSVFTSVSEDVSLQSPRDSIELSSISEISQDHQLIESTESCITSWNPELSASSETVAPSDLPSLPFISAADEDEAVRVSDWNCTTAESKNTVKIFSTEVEMVVNCLKQARIQVMNSTNADLKSKRLLDALINIVIEDFGALPEDKDWYSELASRRTRAMFLTFLLWILAVSAAFLFIPGVRNSFNGPPPT